MNLETLEKVNRLAGTIEEINHAIECIGDLLQHEEKNKDYKVVVRSEYHGKDFGGASVEAKYLYPELREALQKAQVRLRYEVTELKKEFEAL
jgi:hypothetical protein